MTFGAFCRTPVLVAEMVGIRPYCVASTHRAGSVCGAEIPPFRARCWVNSRLSAFICRTPMLRAPIAPYPIDGITTLFTTAFVNPSDAGVLGANVPARILHGFRGYVQGSSKNLLHRVSGILWVPVGLDV